MGAITDRLELEPAEVARHLRLDVDLETDTEAAAEIDALIAGATAAADEYLENDFLDDEGEEAPIPVSVRRFCLNWIDREFRGENTDFSIFLRIAHLKRGYMRSTETEEE